MIETALLDALVAHLKSPGLLPSAPALVGVAEPGAALELPAVTLGLEELERLSTGLGERAVVVTGALAWTERIDLAHAVLAEEPGFNLVSPDRKTLQLPHGGLVKADGRSGAAAAADITVDVGAARQQLAAGAPQSGEFQADLLEGRLIFGDALPASGVVTATYFIGQWERRWLRMLGILRATIFAADVDRAVAVSNEVAAAMDAAPPRIAGLASASLVEMGSVKSGLPGAVAARQRATRFRFEFEFEVNRPDSSGGIIRRIPLRAILT